MTVSLEEVLERSKALGFLGPGEIEPQIAHARAWLDVLDVLDQAARVLDLGSGGGLPGLVLAHDRPHLSLTLLDSQVKRCNFLAAAVVWLDRPEVQVVCGRAETLAHEPGLRASFDVVVARSFGAPAVTAECGVGFLRQGGALWVSEPPDTELASRWPSEGLLELGLEVGPTSTNGMVHLQALRASSLCSQRFPRVVGRPSKRPLF